jgi:hypothetical protein
VALKSGERSCLVMWIFCGGGMEMLGVSERYGDVEVEDIYIYMMVEAEVVV